MRTIGFSTDHVNSILSTSDAATSDNILSCQVQAFNI